jgi:heat-inducible transcriptional repressor
MTRRSDNRGVAADGLSARSRNILAVLVKHYIDTGEPVSSLWLAEHGDIGLSSASVRNIMAELEQRGYVHQPHTSAGRVPTDHGYRCFVDLLLERRRGTQPTREVEARLRQAGTLGDVLSNVSHELSVASRHLAFALMPRVASGTFRHIEFVPLDGTRILVVVSTEDSKVAHKTVDLGESIGRNALEQGAQHLNQEFAGLPLWEVRAAVIEQLRQERMLYDQLRSCVLRLASSTLEDMVPPDRLFVEGAGFLTEGVSDGEDRVPLDTLRTWLTLIERKDLLVRLLNEYIEGPGLTVVIGTEHMSPEMQHFSLVTSTYFDGWCTGSIGIIGPRRMRYSHAIAAVDRVSRAVSRVLVAQATPSENDRRRDSRIA